MGRAPCARCNSHRGELGDVGRHRSGVTLTPRSLLAAVSPVSWGAQPERLHAAGLSNHAPVVPREAAEDGSMPAAVEKFDWVSKLSEAPEHADPIRRWRTHNQLLREALRVVRDRPEIAGGYGATLCSGDASCYAAGGSSDTAGVRGAASCAMSLIKTRARDAHSRACGSPSLFLVE